MSAPCFGWAIDQGRALKLPSAERFVLLVLSNRANGSLVCWPSLPTIATDTGLSQRTVFAAVHALEARKLISITRKGRGMEYRIHRPADPDKPVQPPSAIPQQNHGVMANGHGLSTDLSTDISTVVVEPTQDLRLSQPVQESCSQPLQESHLDSCKICIATLANGESAKCPETRRKLPVSADFANRQTTKKEKLERKSAIAHDWKDKPASQVAEDEVPQTSLDGLPPGIAAAAQRVRDCGRRVQEDSDHLPSVAEIYAKRAEHRTTLAALPSPLADALARLSGQVGRVALAPGCRPERTRAEQIDATVPKTAVKPAYLSSAQLAALRPRIPQPVPAMAEAVA